VLFENVSTVAPLTLPAHASLLTGLTPLEHQVHDNVGFTLRDDVPTLASILGSAGYRTGGFVGSLVLDHRFGLARGFDVYSDAMPERVGGLPERRGEAVLEDALRWLQTTRDEEREKPFFAFLHFYDPHRPYQPPPPFDPGGTDERARYRAEIVYVDSLVGKLLGWLESRHLSDTTVLIVTADHGESLGEHGEETHGFFLYQSTLRVPLLVRGPGVPRGERASELARTIDIAPTALTLLGVDVPPGIDGVGLLGGAPGARPRELEAYSETYIPRLDYGWSELRSLRRRNWKLVLAPRSELYDLDSDPEERRNRIDERADVAGALRARLDELGTGRTVRPGPIDARTLASLRSLGYVGGSAGGELDGRSFLERPDPKDKLSVYNEILDLSLVSRPEAGDVERLAEVLERDPGNPRALRMFGGFMLELRRPAEAKDAYQRLVASQPESFEGYYGLGRAQLELGELDAARASFEAARGIDPKSADVYSRLAAVDKAKGDEVSAERWLREAIAVEPSRVLYQDLADLLLASGRERELVELSSHWNGNGADAATAYARGQLLSSQGNPAGALVELERASRLAPEDDNIEQALANSLSQLGRYPEAMDHYQTIVRRTPCYLGALTNLGAVYERLGRADDAIRSYESAIRCDDRYAAGYRNLGAALARKGDLKRALDTLEKAERLLPDDRELKDALAELRRMTR
jgi:choline-sulfatase